MTIQDYYKEFISKVSSNMDLSLAKNDSIVTMITSVRDNNLSLKAL